MIITKTLLLILLFTLPFIHGRLFQTLGIDLSLIVSGNFEFTKALYFNIFSGIIFLSFFIEKFKIGRIVSLNKNEFSVIIGIFILLTLSTLFSFSQFQSLIGDTEKGHTYILLINLLGMYIVLRNLRRGFLRIAMLTSLGALLCVCAIALKEYFLPTFGYGELSNRALGTFGHPNYLAGYILILLPFIRYFIHLYENILVKLLFVILGIIAGITLIYTKSIFALFLCITYIIYIVFSKFFSDKKYFYAPYLGCISILTVGGLCVLTLYFPEKLHSLLSRFYIWETTGKIIFSSLRVFFFGAGSETLPYYFNAFKVPELYIFENYGFTADRPHNFILYIWYHFGVFMLGVFFYIIYQFVAQNHNKYGPVNASLILFLLFGLFQYFSVASYLVLLVVMSGFFFKTSSQKNDIICLRDKIIQKGVMGIFTFILSISIVGSYYSYKLYYGEILYAAGNTKSANEIFTHPKYYIAQEKYQYAEHLEGIISQWNIKEALITSNNKQILCENLVTTYPSVENYFYCGNIFEKLGNTQEATFYYQTGLLKLPDLWNENSPYWDNYFVNNTISGNRFFAPKFGNIGEIVEKYGN